MSLVGTKIAQYEVLEELARGGMGVVYRARDQMLERDVALKFLPEHQEDEARERFLREARAASRLAHKNIVAIHAIELGERDYIVMELVKGRSLRELLEQGPLPLDESCRIAADVASALATAHKSGIVHRDIKPENIIIESDGNPKVLDFGIAKMEGSSQLTQTDATLGTVSYMSPEQSRGEPVDSRSDIFSLGVILYEMVTGQSPFKGAYPAETTFKILNEDPLPLTTHRADSKPDLQEVVSRCLKKDPSDRYQIAAEVAAELTRVGRATVGSNARDQVSADSGSVSKRSLTRWVWAITVAIVATAALYLGYSDRSERVSSIAVLPFENSTGDSEISFLSDGIPESLINRLTYLPDFKVISRASSFSFREMTDDPAGIGKALGVRTVLLGRLDRRGDQLFINAELVDTRDNSRIWGDRFSHPISEVMQLEEDIAKAIAEDLRFEVTDEASERLIATETSSAEAYQLNLRGRHLMVGSEEEINKAADYFRQAVEIDPTYVSAWAGLAEVLATKANLTLASREELVHEATEAVRRAVEIDPKSPSTLVAQSTIELFFNWNFERAEELARRAVSINPGSSNAHYHLTGVLMALGKADETLESALRAKELDPVSVGATHDLGIAYLMHGRYDEAAAQFEAAVELHPGWDWGYVKGSVVNAFSGNTEDALQLAAIVEERTSGYGSPLIQSWLAHAYARSGRQDLAQGAFEKILAQRKSDKADAIALGYASVATGDYDNAFEWLNTGIDERSPDAIWIKMSGSYSLLKPIGHDPRFEQLINRVGFP